MVNDKKIAFIICTNNERWYNECVHYLSGLELPDDFDADVLQIVDAKSMASGYNEGMHASDAKYKIYLHHDVFIIRTDFIKRVIRAFEEHPEVGIMGVIGTDKIVPDASYWNHWDCGKVYALDAMLPFKVCGPNTYSEGITKAKAVDGMILMTQYDVEWREDIFDGWDFYDASQCFEFIRKGYEVAVFHEDEISIMHDCGYSKLVNYNDSREKFCEEYAEFGFIYEKQEDKDKTAKEKDNSIKKFLNEINWLMGVDIEQAATLIGQVYSDTLRHNTIAILKIIFDIYANEKAANKENFFVKKGDTWEQLTEKYTEYKFLIRRVELGIDPEALDVLYDALQSDKISLQAIGEIACHCCYNGTKVIRKLQELGKSKMKSEVKNYYEIEEFQNMINTAEHVVNQIGRLRIDIHKKIQKNVKVEKNVLKAMGDSMVEIAQLLSMSSYYEEYNGFYSELQSGICSPDICENLMSWENDTKEWMSKLSEAHGVCNICKKVVKYLPNHTHFQAEQRKHGFPYWNAVFESASQKKRACPVCESMDRERMLSLVIDLLQPAEGDKLNVLQIAPSFAMDNWLKTKTYMNYETTDLMMPDVTFQADIQDMSMVEDGTYDIILCSHILEHVEDDIKAMKELHRVLKEDGVCLFLVPLAIGLDKTDEAFGLSAEESWRRFGQDDHARLYAREDFLDRLTDAGYLVHILGKEYFGEGCWQEQGLSDVHCIYAATKKDIGLGIEPYHKAETKEELVSVVIPTYNRGYCIERAVNSVLNQTWKNLELIVVDDASTDDTAGVIQGINDSRIKYIRYEENRGANHARNVGIQNAKGNYIAFNDSDDEWVPEKLEKQMKQLLLADRTDGNVGCVYCVVTKHDKGEVVQVAPDLSVLGESAIGDIYHFMHSHMFISTQTLLMKKEVFEKVGMFNEELKRLQDWELLLRVAQKYKFTLVQESLVNAYIQEECISKNTKGWIDTVFYVIDKHNLVETNRAAYRRLVKIGLSMMENSDLPEEYIESVLKRIDADNVLKISTSPKPENGNVKEPGFDGYSRENELVINKLMDVVSALTKEVEEQRRLINHLYTNYNVKKGWHLEINKEKINYQLQIDKGLGITQEKRETEIIVSLTSYPARMYEIQYTLYSLLHQTLKPDRVILWLAKEQYPNMEEDIADSILALKQNGLSIMWCDDIKSYKKLIPTLKMFPDAIIVTADDDIYYPENWLELLYNSYLSNPKCVHCHRAHAVGINEKGFEPYNNWEKRILSKDASFEVLPTGCGGVLYPPHSLYEDVANIEKFMSLACNADDIWFWAMALLNNTKIQVVKNGINKVRFVNYGREIGLCEEDTLAHYNTGNMHGNDICIRRVAEAYPKIKTLLCNRVANNGREKAFEGSANYWENRYVRGGNSGAGSYNHLSLFKAEVINEFVKKNSVQKVIEWGCGDGNQLSLAEYPQYIGYDVSKEAIKRCTEIFKGDVTKKFIWSGADDFKNLEKADLVLSLDVIYHLVEDSVYELYMDRLFESSSKYVCIYSCNFEKNHAAHVRCRKFTDYVEEQFNNWKLIEVIRNAYPYDENRPNDTSWSDFYIYEKKHEK